VHSAFQKTTKMRNNWLSFMFPEETRNELYHLCTKLSGLFNFNQMAYNDLHMTSIFMGKNYKSKDHERLFKLVEEEKISGFFEFDRLEFFPPAKKNLVVAIFKMSKDVQKKIKALKAKIKEELKYDIDDDDFVPHITLGKISITRKELELVIKKNPLIELAASIHDKSLINFSINIHEPLYLCGEDK
jgi:2'-5' RNA ligase